MSEQETPTTITEITPESTTPNRRWSPVGVRLSGYAVGVLLALGLGWAVISALTYFRAIAQPAPAAPAPLAAVAATQDGSAPVSVSDPSSQTLPTQPAPVDLQRPVMNDAGLLDKVGIQIVYVAITAGGGLIDMRFQVLDPEKAAAMHDPKTPPMLVDEATGAIVNELFMGHSHEHGFQAGQIYYLEFDNPDNIVQSGGTVSVLIGNAEVDHVLVK